MALGPGLHIRQAQTLVMSQQLQQAIKLLALSNVELESVIAEELAKNPLLEARPTEGAAEPVGSDELISALRGEADSPLDMDWREAALDTDSFADVGSSGGADEG